MSHLRLVPSPRAADPAADTPRVPVRLLLALAGRCSCDHCCAGYAHHPGVGRLSLQSPVALHAAR